MNTLSLNFIAPRSLPHVCLAVPVALAATAAVIGTASMNMPGLTAALLSGVVEPAENLWHAQCTHV
jgi:hypothetical protein